MRRHFASRAEVAGRGDDPAPEVVLPEPVDDHTGGQRVIRPADPAGEFEPPARGGLPRLDRRREGVLLLRDEQDSRRPRADRRPLVLDLAPSVDKGRRCLASLLDQGHRLRRGRRLLHFEFVDRPLQTFAAVVFLRVLRYRGGQFFPGHIEGLLGPHRHLLLDGRPVLLRDRQDGPLRLGERLALLLLEGLSIRLFEGVLLLPDRPDPGVDRGDGLLVGVFLFLRGDRLVDHLGAGEDGLQAVVVGRRDRVELVVMAAGAGHRQAEEDRADRPGDLGQLRLPPDRRIDVPADDLPRPAAPEPGGDQGLGRPRLGLVPGQLQGHEPVIAGMSSFKAPARPSRDTSRRSGRSASSSNPFESACNAPGRASAAAPPFAELGAAQEPIHEPFIGPRPVVGEEGGDLLGRWRQADQVGRDPTDQGDPIGLRCRAESGRLQLGEEEAIDRVPRPIRIPDARDFRPGDGLEGPVGALLVAEFLGRRDVLAPEEAGDRQDKEDGEESAASTTVSRRVKSGDRPTPHSALDPDDLPSRKGRFAVRSLGVPPLAPPTGNNSCPTPSPSLLISAFLFLPSSRLPLLRALRASVVNPPLPWPGRYESNSRIRRPS